MSEIPPFEEAVERLRGFLRLQGINGEVLWVFREDLSVKGGQGQVWVRLPLPERNNALARMLYDKGRDQGIGVSLSVYCVVGDDACCYVWVPKDELDAQYAMVSGLKLSVPEQTRRARPRTVASAVRHALSKTQPDPWLDEVPAAADVAR